jgi:hypothetical protein
VAITTPLIALKSVVETDAVERNQKPLAMQGSHGFRVEIHPHEIVTIRLSGDAALAAPVE